VNSLCLHSLPKILRTHSLSPLITLIGYELHAYVHCYQIRYFTLVVCYSFLVRFYVTPHIAVTIVYMMNVLIKNGELNMQYFLT